MPHRTSGQSRCIRKVLRWPRSDEGSAIATSRPHQIISRSISATRTSMRQPSKLSLGYRKIEPLRDVSPQSFHQLVRTVLTHRDASLPSLDLKLLLPMLIEKHKAILGDLTSKAVDRPAAIDEINELCDCSVDQGQANLIPRCFPCDQDQSGIASTWLVENERGLSILRNELRIIIRRRTHSGHMSPYRLKTSDTHMGSERWQMRNPVQSS